jgi:hypothetical protein
LAEEREDGDSHRERFAGGGGSCVGKGVEREVEVVVGVEVVFGGLGERAEVESGLVDALLGESLKEFRFEFFVGEFGGLDEQVCFGALFEDGAPDFDG